MRSKWALRPYYDILSSLITIQRGPERAKELNKKSKKINQPPSGLITGWDRDVSGSKVTAGVTASEHDVDESMVRFGGLVKDEEDDEIERVAIRKDVSKGGVGKKILVGLKLYYSILDLTVIL
jgi:hypothetical protein